MQHVRSSVRGENWQYPDTTGAPTSCEGQAKGLRQTTNMILGGLMREQYFPLTHLGYGEFSRQSVRK